MYARVCPPLCFKYLRRQGATAPTPPEGACNIVWKTSARAPFWAGKARAGRLRRLPSDADAKREAYPSLTMLSAFSATSLTAPLPCLGP